MGVALESLVVLTAQNILILKGLDRNAYNMINSLDNKKILKRRAGQVLVGTYRIKHAERGQMRKYIREYRYALLLIKSSLHQFWTLS